MEIQDKGIHYEANQTERAATVASRIKYNPECNHGAIPGYIFHQIRSKIFSNNSGRQHIKKESVSHSSVTAICQDVYTRAQ
jgi:hypothetical protein